jgi:AcrR family transcriptional regulator
MRPSAPPLTRRDRRRVEIRSRIIEAAHRLFQANGYRASTVNEICEQADVAYKTFFNHFPSKHDVLVEIERRSLDALLAHLADALDLGGSTRERVEDFFERIAAEAEAAGPMHRELLTELIHSAHSGGEEPEQVQRVARAIERIVEVGVERGDVRTDASVATIAEMIRGAYYSLMISFANLAEYPIVDRARELATLVGDSIEARAMSTPSDFQKEP